MKRRYRARYEIIAEILKVTQTGASRTLIKRKCDLSSSQLCKYLQYLVNVGLIGVEQKVFKITEKGKEWLERYQEELIAVMKN